MTIVVFCGPTIGAQEVRALLPDARVLPPVSQGDVLREARTHPSAMVLIDGYFERVPSVWHKEILWAMDRGIRMFGASSIGALRAAELANFGMIGHGEIYRLFASCALEDDDEVAVTHGPMELGYPACSDAMVNIRASLEAAQREGLLSCESRRKLERIAKSLFFADRTIDEILARAAHWMPPNERDTLRQWWSIGRIDLKKRDAISLLRSLAVGDLKPNSDSDMQLPTPSWQFEATLHWLRLQESVRATTMPNKYIDLPSKDASDAISFLKLPLLEPFAQFILNAAAQRSITVSFADYAAVAEKLCLIADMRLPSDVDEWLLHHGYDIEDFRALISWTAIVILLFEEIGEASTQSKSPSV